MAMYLSLKNETPYGSGVCGMLSEQEVQGLELDFDSIAETPAGNLLKRSRDLWRAGRVKWTRLFWKMSLKMTPRVHVA